MDPFRLSLAFGPVAIYLMLLGRVHLRRRPWLISGIQDTTLLAGAVSGLLIVGPLDLFVPVAAAIRFGSFTWVLLLGLLLMGVLWLLLSMRPRLVIYNISTDQLRPVLAEVVSRVDAEARWAGDCLALPTLGVQLYLEGSRSMRYVSLISGGPRQSHEGWYRLREALAHELAEVTVTRNLRATGLLAVGTLAGSILIWLAVRDPSATMHAFLDMLRF